MVGEGGVKPLFSSKSCVSLPAFLCLSAERRFLPETGGLTGSSVAVGNGPRLHRGPQQHPGGTAANPQLQKWSWTPSRTRVVKMIGGFEELRGWGGDIVEAYGVIASSWVPHRWTHECCNLGQWMSASEVFYFWATRSDMMCKVGKAGGWRGGGGGASDYFPARVAQSSAVREPQQCIWWCLSATS